MALLNTVGSFMYPNHGKWTDVTSKRVIYIQTAGSSGATAAGISVFQTASTAKLGCGVNEFHLTNLVVSITKPSTTAEVGLYLGTTQLCQLATAASSIINLDFGEFGLVGPDVTTTATVSIVSTTGGATARFVCTGYYEV